MKPCRICTQTFTRGSMVEVYTIWVMVMGRRVQPVMNRSGLNLSSRLDVMLQGEVLKNSIKHPLCNLE